MPCRPGPPAVPAESFESAEVRGGDAAVPDGPGACRAGPGRFTFLDGRAWHPRGRAAPGADRGLLARPEVTNGPAAARMPALPWWCEYFNVC